MTHLDEKAIKTSYDLPWSLEEFTRKGQRCANIVSNYGTIVCEIRGILDSCGNRENGELIVRAVNSLGALSALPSSPVSELVERLNGENPDKVVPTDRLRMYAHDPDTFEFDQHDALSLIPIIEESASTLTTLSTRNAELEREVKRLREVMQPFADVADHDIGDDEDDQDVFRPMTNHNSAAKITVGDMRAVLAALSTSPQGGEHE